VTGTTRNKRKIYERRKKAMDIPFAYRHPRTRLKKEERAEEVWRQILELAATVEQTRADLRSLTLRLAEYDPAFKELIRQSPPKEGYR
jgi:hypothetical protein